MVAIITFLCGLLGLWINIYSIFAIVLFAIYYYRPFNKVRWENVISITGLVLGAVNIILTAITRQF